MRARGRPHRCRAWPLPPPRSCRRPQALCTVNRIPRRLQIPRNRATLPRPNQHEDPPIERSGWQGRTCRPGHRVRRSRAISAADPLWQGAIVPDDQEAQEERLPAGERPMHPPIVLPGCVAPPRGARMPSASGRLPERDRWRPMPHLDDPRETRRQSALSRTVAAPPAFRATAWVAALMASSITLGSLLSKSALIAHASPS